MTKLLPLYDNVIVRRAPKDTATASGIQLVHRRSEHPNQGEVIAVGRDFADVGVGDQVIWDEGRGQPIDFEGDKLLHLKAQDVIAVVTP